MIDSAPLIIVAIVILLGLGLLALISRFQPKRRLDNAWYQSQWRGIELQFVDGKAGQKLAVINADKLVDRAMSEKAFKGKTMGEKLKNHPNAFSNLNGVWRAHKLRNRIAHDHSEVSEVDCRYALNDLRQALKELGAL